MHALIKRKVAIVAQMPAIYVLNLIWGMKVATCQEQFVLIFLKTFKQRRCLLFISWGQADAERASL